MPHTLVLRQFYAGIGQAQQCTEHAESKLGGHRTRCLARALSAWAAVLAQKRATAAALQAVALAQHQRTLAAAFGEWRRLLTVRVHIQSCR